MERRSFTREFKLEAVRLAKVRGVSVAQAAGDLAVHGNMLRKWIRNCEADPQHSFPGQGQMKEIERARRWASGGVAEGLDAVLPQKTSKTGRDVFLYVISGFKQRNPSAAMAMIERLNQRCPCRTG